MDFLSFFFFRVNGKLVALKVIRLQEEEGTPFTAIREGRHFLLLSLLLCLHDTCRWLNICTSEYAEFLNCMVISLIGMCKLKFKGSTSCSRINHIK